MSDLVVRQTGEIVTDFGMQAVVSVDQAINRIKELQRFVHAVMVKGEDYGIIPGTKKPTLLKPGAEKLCEMYGLTPTFSEMAAEKDWANGFVYHEIKCSLVSKRTGLVSAEGVGSCNNRETKYVSRDVYTISNTILKMAKKRALVDATLSATRSSGLFTQDVEDMVEAIQDEDHPQNARPPASNETKKQEGKAGSAQSDPTAATATPTDDHMATERQIKAIYAAAKSVGMESSDIDAICEQKYGARPSSLSRHDASEVITNLQARS